MTVALGISSAILLALVGLFFKLWRSARDDATLWQEQSKRLVTDLRDHATAAAEERARLDAGAAAATHSREESDEALGDLVEHHPDLAPEFLDRVFKDAASSGPRPHAPLPEGAAPDVPGGGRRRGS